MVKLQEDPEELKQNVRFDLLHKENQKSALETIMKIKTFKEESLDSKLKVSTDRYAFDYALSPDPRSVIRKRNEEDNKKGLFLFKVDSPFNLN